MTSELWRLSACEIVAGVKSGAFSASEAVRAALDRMEAVNGRINAVVDSDPQAALAAAARVDARIDAGEDPGPLAGVPVTVKVTHDQAGFATTMGIRKLKDHRAAANSPIVDNFERAGAIPIGRTNMPAFGLRWFTNGRLHGDTYNPFDRSLTPGGSSGGASAAVASGIGAIAHGTDIAGSIRYPAYACGVHGLRPTLGRIPNYNASFPERGLGGQLMSVSGPLARTVADIELSFAALAHADPRDPWWVPAPLAGPARPRRVALCLRPDGLEIDAGVADALLDAAARLRDAGWEVAELDDIPPMRDAAVAQVTLWLGDEYPALLAEAQAEGDPGALAMLRGQPQSAGVTLQSYCSALKARASYLRQWMLFFEDYPLMMLPVSARLPFANDLDTRSAADYDSVWEAQMPQLGLAFMGLPCMSVATGMCGSAPVGIQLAAGRYREDLLFLAAEDIAARGMPPVPVDPV